MGKRSLWLIKLKNQEGKLVRHKMPEACLDLSRPKKRRIFYIRKVRSLRKTGVFSVRGGALLKWTPVFCWQIAESPGSKSWTTANSVGHDLKSKLNSAFCAFSILTCCWFFLQQSLESFIFILQLLQVLDSEGLAIPHSTSLPMQ